jgi:GntR family transcriptional regulator/MocR family aminotransferase
MARDMAIARGTATAVYERLVAEGLVSIRERSAVIVAEGVVAERRRSRETYGPSPFRAMQNAIASDAALPPPFPAFLPGVPALDIFPSSVWSRILAAHGRNMAPDIAGEGMYVGGYPALRVALADHLGGARGVDCDSDQVVVTNSARAALTAVCRLLARPGDSCLVEDPGYPIAHRIIVGCGLEAVPIPVDGAGMDVGADLPDARLAYVTPTCQMPLGVSLSPKRCDALLAWARGGGRVIEDDCDSDPGYAGRL